MKNLFRVFTILSFSVLSIQSFSQTPVITGFYLPENISNGLSWCGFEIVPRFQSLDGELWLNMRITLSTPAAIQGSYEYRYRYDGKVYTDKMIGGEVFQPINISQVIFEITVQGPGVNVTTTYDKILGFQAIKDTFGPAKIPSTAKPSDYFITIRGIKEISFTGTRAITKKIEELVLQKNSEEQYINILGQADEGFRTGKFTEAQSLYKKAQAIKPSETYPKTQLAKIDEVLKDEAIKADSQKKQAVKEPGKQEKTTNRIPVKKDDFWDEHPVADNAVEKKEPEVDHVGETIEKLEESNKTYWAEKEKSDRATEKSASSLTQSFYAAQAIRDGKQSLSNNTRLDGNYNSVEELENAFNQKYQAIHSDVDNINKARNDGFQSVADRTFSGSGENGQATGRILGGIASNINDARAEKERKQAEQALEEAREKKMAEMEERETALKEEMRRAFLAQFPDGGVPLSSDRLGTSHLFYFAYVCDENDIATITPYITLTNVFRLDQYSDGTWPLKANLKRDLQKFGKGTVTLMGYYTTELLAKEMHASFTSLSKKCGFHTFNVTYKEQSAKSTAVAPSVDFWGNDQKATPAEPKKENKTNDDFWNN